MSDVVLEIKNLTRRFGAFTAVDDLTLAATARFTIASVSAWLCSDRSLSTVTLAENKSRSGRFPKSRDSSDPTR